MIQNRHDRIQNCSKIPTPLVLDVLFASINEWERTFEETCLETASFWAEVLLKRTGVDPDDRSQAELYLNHNEW